MAFSKLKAGYGTHWTVHPCREDIRDGLAVTRLQDMLHSGSAVHLRLRPSRRDISKAPLCWCACDGMGYRRGRNHGEHRCSLYVFSLYLH